MALFGATTNPDRKRRTTRCGRSLRPRGVGEEPAQISRTHSDVDQQEEGEIEVSFGVPPQVNLQQGEQEGHAQQRQAGTAP